jgi:polyphosphate kinase
LFELSKKADKPELKYASYLPSEGEYTSIFDKIKERDFMVHLPYQSFHSTVDLIESAAKDKDVLAIKITLYRTNRDSAIIEALKTAAKNKKQVTAIVEIKARFDEERNSFWNGY